MLNVEGSYAAFRDIPGLRDAAVYLLVHDNDVEVTDDAQGADWARDGRLLVATREGRLEARSPGAGSSTLVEDLSRSTPEPVRAPVWAEEW